MDRSKTGILIPALNEEATITAVITHASRFGQPIVVDDGSSDRTGALAAAAGAVVVRHEVNRGYDAALNSAFARAHHLGFDVVLTLDADGQHDPEVIGRFLHALADGADVALGVRDRHQRMAESLFAWVAQRKLGVQDPLCGLKAYKMAVYAALGHFDAYGSIGTELALFAATHGYRVVQISITTRPRVGESRFGRQFAANARILRALWLGTIFRRAGARLASKCAVTPSESAVQTSFQPTAPVRIERPAGCANLVLGTVQLGLPYGIANVSGQPDPGEADRIVAAVWQQGVVCFDTAQAYGASEEVLGRALTAIGGNRVARVITKLSPDSDCRDLPATLRALEASLRRLRVQQLWGLLLHREEDLDQWHGPIGEMFQMAKDAGLVAQAGVSVYSPERAFQALECDGIEIIQVPANVFDRRMARSGFFGRAKTLGKKVMIRSVYLQGLALLPAETNPRGIPHARPATETLRRFCDEREISLQQFAVDHVRTMAPDAKLIIGAETETQARHNCALFQSAPDSGEVHQQWAEAWPTDFPELVDPRLWPARLEAR